MYICVCIIIYNKYIYIYYIILITIYIIIYIYIYKGWAPRRRLAVRGEDPHRSVYLAVFQIFEIVHQFIKNEKPSLELASPKSRARTGKTGGTSTMKKYFSGSFVQCAPNAFGRWKQYHRLIPRCNFAARAGHGKAKRL